ncbi:hypothetical protein BP6252_01960 [Coleophoma cylindrospora]|uniref:Uncharacterized protein n=1 Tax=Coleophoma cylindrospora TaxID=1849047 RepID=A0A3D8SDG1_9HELO|nr:hypothetical protein BP6252_01960 [Coleophoma cylindrospora]
MANKASQWAKVSEPSGNALEQYRKAEFKRSNVSGLKDPQAAAKLKIPSTRLPDDAIMPSGKGPEPEEILRKQKESKAKAPGSSGSSSKAQSVRSSTLPPSTGNSSRTNPGSITEESSTDPGSPIPGRKR